MDDKTEDQNRIDATDLNAVINSLEWVQSNLSELSNRQLMQELEIIKMWLKNKQ